MRQAHPVFSRAGCLGGLVVVVGVAAAMALSGGAIFSPGALTAFADGAAPGMPVASHAEIGTDCGQCHQPFAGIAAERCEACHTQVGQQRAAGIGLHGALAEQAARCDTCHSDHRGRDFDPSAAALAQFDHETAGFSLARHVEDFDGQPLACADCHRQPDYIYEPAACLTCHAQADTGFMAQHTAAFGPDCLACHDGTGALSSFDHAQTGFALDGEHAALACADCHRPGTSAGETARQCAECHAEPAVHAGLFGTACAACHTTTAWTPARLTSHAFPLDHGDEGELPCAACHTDSYAAYICTDCHEHPPDEMVEEHADEGVVGERLLDCAACHPNGEKD